jgi:hypothetical protein
MQWGEHQILAVWLCAAFFLICLTEGVLTHAVGYGLLALCVVRAAWVVWTLWETLTVEQAEAYLARNGVQWRKVSELAVPQ